VLPRRDAPRTCRLSPSRSTRVALAERSGGQSAPVSWDDVKVAIVVPRFPVVSETFVVSRFVRLTERGLDVRIFCEDSPDEAWGWFAELADRRLKPRVHVRPRNPSHLRVALLLPVVLIRCLVAAPGRTIRYLLRGVRTYGRYVAGRFVEDEALIRFGPDVVHFEFGGLAVNREATGRLLGCALVVSFQGYDINYVGLDDPGHYARLWQHVDAVHFVSDDLLRRARRRGFTDEEHAFVVHNGIDTSAFRPGDRSHGDEVGTVDRPLRLVSIGRLHWKKGYNYALTAVRILRDRGLHVTYHIIGDGDGKRAVLYDIDDLGLTGDVVLAGSVPPERVRAELSWADVCVHAAVSEGFCLAVTEAQAMGTPVVCTDADGLRDNVADGVSGFVVPRRDAEALAARIAELAKDPLLRAQMSKAGIERVRECFTIDAHVDGIERMYHSVT
jgi:colanic acid/amylovoran biosynthesis glycosyltransferase